MPFKTRSTTSTSRLGTSLAPRQLAFQIPQLPSYRNHKSLAELHWGRSQICNDDLLWAPWSPRDIAQIASTRISPPQVCEARHIHCSLSGAKADLVVGQGKALFGGPYNEDHGMIGSILGTPFLGTAMCGSWPK